jgi:hypothetical protein
MNGKQIKMLADLPSAETAPSGNDNVQNVARAFDWRDDDSSNCYLVYATRQWFNKNKVDFHDAVFALSAPFNGSQKNFLKTQMRYRTVGWGVSSLHWF